ncbi:IS3 family transposase [Maize bushy stunt phytoplasma]|uniref:IS3 family transposase n=1 Tax=Maize bushy stunt phytoplasma TaxID=202462 RepID=UPI000A00B2F6|nr:IS3 family transposase [Maize bushy stunt phytoplasma]
MKIDKGFKKENLPPFTYLTSFFSSFKCECIYYGIPNPRTISKKVMIEAICKYMSYYNLERMHSSLNYTTPDAFEKNIFKS